VDHDVVDPVIGGIEPEPEPDHGGLPPGVVSIVGWPR
jgi:hypothetical protein